MINPLILQVMRLRQSRCMLHVHKQATYTAWMEDVFMQALNASWRHASTIRNVDRGGQTTTKKKEGL